MALPHLPHVEKAYSSPMVRSKQTARALFSDFEVLPDSQEVTQPKHLYGKNLDYVKSYWALHLPNIRNNPSWQHNGSESFSHVKKRATKFASALQSLPYSTIVVVGHGIFFRHVLGVLRFGAAYNFSQFETILRPKKWKHLSIREVVL